MTKTHTIRSKALLGIFGLILAVAALPLVIDGMKMASLGGSVYYIITGIALLIAGGLLALRRTEALWLFAATTAASVIWALWEVGLDFWQLVPRLAPFVVMTLIFALLTPVLAGRWRKRSWLVAGLAAAAFVSVGVLAFVPHGVTKPDASAAARQEIAAPAESRWQYYGRAPDGTRFAPESQITPENVAELEVAWTYRTGDIGQAGGQYQSTPIQIGNTLYFCTPLNRVIALNATTGEQVWDFDPGVENTGIWNRCRGVGYYQSAQAAQGDICAERIVLTTLDARLIQLDSQTGELCQDFGTGGTVDLKAGMGEIKPSHYQPTSMPTIVGGRVVVGGWVQDNHSVDEPSGVVRAFDAETGDLIWAWDIGRPGLGLPEPGESYSRATPNVWSTPAFDEGLGLIYLPTGSHQPDFFGGLRPEISERYSTSVVALDIATGEERWVFQTVHHDLWDLDVASQPALYDISGEGGETIPVLAQVTKRGQIFLLDRRTGEPVAEVEERPVPQEHAEGDWVSPTQPYSIGMPAIGTEPLTEASMWGATFYDQLQCRIQFRQLRYEGEFTAPTLEPSIVYPGYYGGMNWGSAAVDHGNGYLIVNDIRMPGVVKLVNREVADSAPPGAHAGMGYIQPQSGTPYGIEHLGLMSPLGIPCNAPPWGTFSAIDLETQQLVWQRPAGTIADMYLNGNRIGLPIPLGAPTLGGPLATGSGLVFHAGTQDYYLRAMNSSTGEELWSGRLPVGAQATPMTYISPESGRQYVVVVAGGARQSPDLGDYVIAYALPDGAGR